MKTPVAHVSGPGGYSNDTPTLSCAKAFRVAPGESATSQAVASVDPDASETSGADGEILGIHATV